MKVAAIYAAMPGFEQGLNYIMNIFRETFGELGVDIETINLSAVGVHYFDGIKSSAVENILMNLADADGIIFASSTCLYSPSAIMQTFIEHMDFSIYQNVFNGKKCFVITTSKDGNERDAAEYLAKVINKFGGIDAGRMPVGSEYITLLNSDESVRETVEKYAEDFYRIMRQDRMFFISHETHKPHSYGETVAITGKMNKMDVGKNSGLNEVLYSKGQGKKKVKAEELLKQIDFAEFDHRQEEDISEISKILNSEYGKTVAETPFKTNNVHELYKKSSSLKPNEKIVPHIQTCKQRTQSLYHYFQPQLSGGIEAVIQINIRGDEKFEGYIVIKNGECSYHDGVHTEPDVTVFAQSNIWLDILDGKYTTQKAFMIGQLKVRGNFVLLTKFDQLFNIVKNLNNY